MNQIKITIDEKACRGCSLCADICPTKVFEGVDKNGVPLIKNEKECFGCLSCAEICPAAAISHTGHPLSMNYYHDASSLKLTSAMGKPPREISIPRDETAVGAAMRDLGMRLLSVASVLKQTVGQSLPSVGTMAGMSLAAKLPRYRTAGSIEEACSFVSRAFAPSWELNFSFENDGLSITVGNCFIRNLCREEKLGLGGDLCVLFYNYLAGYFSKISGKRPRLKESVPGERQCIYYVKLYG